MDSMPLLPITSSTTLHRCKHLPLSERDIFICSYPKSGTTWTCQIIYQLATKGQEELSHISDYAPFFEIDKTWEGGQIKEAVQWNHTKLGRQLFNTHLRWDKMPTDQGPNPQDARYVYMVRDGRDVAVSYYHHLVNMAVEDGGFAGSWEEFFDQWCQGRIVYGRWCDHLVSWLRGPAAKDPRVLVVKYEDLKGNLREGLEMIAAHCHFKLSSEEMDLVEERCTFQYMSTHRQLFEPVSVTWRDPAFRFIRKGEVGDYRSLLTLQQEEQFRCSLPTRFGGEDSIPDYILSHLGR